MEPMVLQRGNPQTAWKRVRANKGAAGIDGMTIDEFPDWARSGHWKEVVAALEAGTYKPSPANNRPSPFDYNKKSDETWYSSPISSCV